MRSAPLLLLLLLALACARAEPGGLADARSAAEPDAAESDAGAMDARHLFSDLERPDLALDDLDRPDLARGDLDRPPFDGGDRLDGGERPDARPGGRDGGSVGCARLGMCCPSLPSRLADSCRMTVMNDDPRACEQALATARAAGYCGADGGLLPDLGLGDGPRFDLGDGLDGGLGPRCLALDECCGTLPPAQQTTCRSGVMGGRERECGFLLEQARMRGLCLPMDAGRAD